MPVKIALSIKEVDLSNIKVPVIAVYEHPSDYPEYYVARVFNADRPTDTIMLKDTLEEIQKDIRDNTNMMFMLRGAEDEPCIVGAWL